MWAAVDGVVSPEKDAAIMRVFVTGSIITVTFPVAGELFGGDSFAAFKTAPNVKGLAKAAEFIKSRSAKTKATFMTTSIRCNVGTDVVIIPTSSNRVKLSGQGRSIAITAVPRKQHGHNEEIAADPESFPGLLSL